MAIPATSTAHPNHRFRVEIDGVANLDFSEVILPEARTDVVEYREGGNVSPRKISGPVHYSNLVLRRSVTTSNDLFNWWKTVAGGQMNQRTSPSSFSMSSATRSSAGTSRTHGARTISSRH